MHYYNFNPSDFNAKTRHLTHLERAFYRDLIDLYYTTEKPIMADLPKLERLLIAKSDDEKQALAMVLDEFFVLKNAAYHDFEMTAKIRAYKWAEKKRNTKGTENGTDKEHIGTLSGTEKERKQRHKNKVNFLRTLLSDNGIQTTTNASIKALTALCNEHKIFIDWDKAKQQAQHSGTKRNGQGTENGTDKEHIGTPKNERITINHKPITINQEPNNISPQTPQGACVGDDTAGTHETTKETIQKTYPSPKADETLNVPFETFWDSYDKKISPEKCRTLWKRLSNKERLDIMAYLPKYKQSQPDKKYRKHPQTFLNNRSWEDEIIDSTSKPAWQPPQPPSRMDELRQMAMTSPTNIYVNDLPDFDNPFSANPTNFIGVTYE